MAWSCASLEGNGQEAEASVTQTSGCPHCSAARSARCPTDPTGSSGDRSTSNDRERDGDGTDDTHHTCRCHEQGRDMVREGVRDGSIALPVFVAVLEPLTAVLTAVLPPVVGVLPTLQPQPGMLAPSPPTALLRLHTLLLT